MSVFFIFCKLLSFLALNILHGIPRLGRLGLFLVMISPWMYFVEEDECDYSESKDISFEGVVVFTSAP